MALAGESSPDFNDSISAARMEFRVREDQGGETIADRLEYRTMHAVTRSDALPGGTRPSEWAHVDDSLGTLSAGDAAALRALLLKLYNQSKSDLGL